MIRIGNVLMPPDLEVRGRFLPPEPEILGRNGRGMGIATLTYISQVTYNTLPRWHFFWWYATLLGGNISREFTTGNFFVDSLGFEIRPASMTVHRPTYTAIRNNFRYESVVVKITDIFL